VAAWGPPGLVALIVRPLLASLALARLVAQGQGDASLGELQTGLFEGTLERFRVALQKGKRFDPIDREAGLHAPLLVDIEAHLDAAQLNGIETDLEMIDAGKALEADLDRHRGEGNVGNQPDRRL